MTIAPKPTQPQADAVVEAQLSPVELKVASPSGKPWAYGIRTWDADGTSYDGFVWNLEVGSRTEAPDWNTVPECGHGLHCNADGPGDWSLLSDDTDAILGIVRYDPDLAIDLDGKIKAPWMEIVLTTKTASRASVMGFIAQRSREKIAELIAGSSTTRASKDGEHASAAGDRGHASAAGDRGHASAAGYSGIAVALGIEGRARAAKTGAIMLAAWAPNNKTGRYDLAHVFAGMVGQTYGAVTIKPDVWYDLDAKGQPREISDGGA